MFLDKYLKYMITLRDIKLLGKSKNIRKYIAGKCYSVCLPVLFVNALLVLPNEYIQYMTF